MRKFLLISAAFAALTTSAFPAERTVGSSVSNYAQTTGMKSWTAARTPGRSTEPPGEVAEDMTGHISDPEVKGNAKQNFTK